MHVKQFIIADFIVRIEQKVGNEEKSFVVVIEIFHVIFDYHSLYAAKSEPRARILIMPVQLPE